MAVQDQIHGDIKRFQENLGLKPAADLEMILLKGHLLIEELLQKMVESLVPCPDELLKARFTFHHWLCLAKALRNPSIHPELKWVWGGVEKINNLRNLMAHNLAPKHFEQRLHEFITSTLVKIHMPVPIKPTTGRKDQMAKLGFTLSVLNAFLSQLVRANIG
jgi:hypothetical protein